MKKFALFMLIALMAFIATMRPVNYTTGTQARLGARIETIEK